MGGLQRADGFHHFSAPLVVDEGSAPSAGVHPLELANDRLASR